MPWRWKAGVSMNIFWCWIFHKKIGGFTNSWAIHRCPFCINRRCHKNHSPFVALFKGYTDSIYQPTRDMPGQPWGYPHFWKASKIFKSAPTVFFPLGFRKVAFHGIPWPHQWWFLAFKTVRCFCGMNSWLVLSTYPSEKYELVKVSWEDDIPI